MTATRVEAKVVVGAFVVEVDVIVVDEVDEIDVFEDEFVEVSSDVGVVEDEFVEASSDVGSSDVVLVDVEDVSFVEVSVV